MNLTLDSTGRAKVWARVKSRFSPKSFRASQLRGVLLGIILTATLGEVFAYILLKQDIRAGDLPSYAIDVIIIGIAMMETLLAPFLSWWGFRRRRALLISYSVLTTMCVISWFFMPPQRKREESEFCNAANASNSTAFLGVPPHTAARLALLLVSCTTFMATRVACWSHGIAYCDEFAPERTSVHYGVLLVTRAIPMILVPKLLANELDNHVTMHCIGMVIGMMPNLVQLVLFLPSAAPTVKGVQKTALPHEHRSFLTSVGRVCSNPLAMLQIFAMASLATALFGYMYYENDIAKVKFNLVPERNATLNIAEVFQYIAVILIVAFAGNLFSQPILSEFRSAAAIKQVIKMTVLAIVVYVIMTVVIGCDHGYVSGLGDDHYKNPACSLHCGCKAGWREFAPVCSVDDMVSYASPCQAGCGASEFVNGVRIYTNCTCTVSGRAVVGACNDVLCKQSHRLHSMLLLVVLTLSLLAFQGQGMLVLRSVDPRDKSVAMGVTWAMVALTAFVGGHLLFVGIRVLTCRWFESNVCHLQVQSYPYYVGGTSAILAFVSLLISIVTAISIRKANRNSDSTRL